jgi:ABC-type multidrug transport system ATPase subunit
MEPRVGQEGEVLLAARRVSRRFGSELALATTDLEVRAGDVLALVGPNGAGKSTMLALLAGALEPTAGTVERRDGVRVGWAPQRPGHYARLSVLENLRRRRTLRPPPSVSSSGTTCPTRTDSPATSLSACGNG